MGFETTFDSNTLADLRRILGTSSCPPKELANRLAILSASPPETEIDRYDAYRVKRLVAGQTAWREYVNSAERVGLLDSDLIARLRNADEDQFYGAMGECLSAWFFAEQLGCDIRARPRGQRSSLLEFTATRGTVECDVETKASGVERPGNRWSGDDTEVLMTDIRAAARQLRRGRRNIVVLVPHLRTSVLSDRDQLLKAVVGQAVIRITVDLGGGGAPRGSEPGFKFDGLMTRGGGGKNEDGSSRRAHTRIGAVLSLEEICQESAHANYRVDLEKIRTDDDAWKKALVGFMMARYTAENELTIERRAIVVHNPEAAIPIPEEFFGEAPQFVRRGETLSWTDGGQGA